MKDNTSTFSQTLIKFLQDNQDKSCVTESLFESAFQLEIEERYAREEDREFKSSLAEIVSSVENVDNYGGEDMGSDYWSVYKFTSLDETEEVLVKFQGYYQSFNGSEYQELFEVKPQPVQKIEYVKV